VWGADEAAKVRQVVYALLLPFLLCSNPTVFAMLK
jgi:hypothetical protein